MRIRTSAPRDPDSGFGDARLRPARWRRRGRPLVLLTVCVAVAAAGLAWVAVRAAIQERAAAVRDIRDAAALGLTPALRPSPL